jgi:hypothetical protein
MDATEDKPIKYHELTHAEWRKIREQLCTEFGQSMIMLRSRMRDELGFLPREHCDWVPKMDGGHWGDTVIHIDFYTEQARTWFLLKFV